MSNQTISQAPFKVEGTVTGRLPPNSVLPPKWWKLDRDMPNSLIYKSRYINAILGSSSHGTIALVNEVVHQEKFRADPRFPLFQMMQRVKRYKAIFAGIPYLPIFS